MARAIEKSPAVCCEVLLVPYTPIYVTGKVLDKASGIIEVRRASPPAAAAVSRRFLPPPRAGENIATIASRRPLSTISRCRLAPPEVSTMIACAILTIALTTRAWCVCTQPLVAITRAQRCDGSESVQTERA